MKEEEKMEVKKGMEKEYESYVGKNQDSYGHAVILAAVKVGKALTEGKTVKEAKEEMYGFGLSGYMAGCVSSTIAHYHKKGEEYRIFWNKQYNISKDKKGVVNPALMTGGNKNGN